MVGINFYGVLLCLTLTVLIGITKCGVIYDDDNALEELLYGNAYETYSQPKKQCPYCDSSVFGYCGEKLFHDSCCCNNRSNPHYPLPYKCQFADCSFLHSNSCYEHKLITACCCLS